jgi:hypothetical protein
MLLSAERGKGKALSSDDSCVAVANWFLVVDVAFVFLHIFWFQSVPIRSRVCERSQLSFSTYSNTLLLVHTCKCHHRSLHPSASGVPEYNDCPLAAGHRFMDSISTRLVRSRTIRIRIRIFSFVPHHGYGYGGFALFVLFSVENRLFLLMNMDVWCLYIEWITEQHSWIDCGMCA